MKICRSDIVLAGVFLLLCRTVLALEPDILYSFPLGPVSPQGRLVLGRDGKFYGTSAFGGYDGFKAYPWGPVQGCGTVFTMDTNGVVNVLAAFNGTNGIMPQAGLVEGLDGSLYGVTSGMWNVSNAATVFKITTNGNLTVLAHLNTTNASELLLGRDGNFYGTTMIGGNNNAGTVYRFTSAGAFTTLVHFPKGLGGFPKAGLAQGRDGYFYGTTTGGAYNAGGTVFKMTQNGGLTTLAAFNGTNGMYPEATLVEGTDGNFYGTTELGGQYNSGTLFEVTSAGALTTLVSFANTNGAWPKAGLVQAPDGNFYGTTSGGGPQCGTVYQFRPDGTLLTLASFTSADGYCSFAQLVMGLDGSLYGTTAFGGNYGSGGSLFRMTTNGVFSTLALFGNYSGASPQAGLTLGGDGNLYGTTSGGGTNMQGSGTVFKISPNGEFTSLTSFAGPPDGSVPSAPLTLATDGKLYGTTRYGGSNGYGTVYSVSTNGQLTILASFNSLDNGAYPLAGLALGADGNLYGTAWQGGAYGQGTVFRYNTNGTLTALVSFNGTNGGANPNAPLLLGPDGQFYGTTSEGGKYGVGTVFGMTPGGVLTTLAHFDNTNGSLPNGELVLGNDGNFYGTAYGNNTWPTRDGSVFKMTPAGDLSTFFTFGITNGLNPSGGLLLGHDGNFYGTTEFGGRGSYGTVFQLTTNGTLTTLLEFDGTNGYQAFGPLMRGSDGNLYAVTSAGGRAGLGTVFRLPLAKFTSVSKQAGGNVLLSAVGLPGDSYRLWASSNPLGSWSLLTTNNFDTIGNASITDWSALTNPSRFYRLSVP